MSTEILDFTEEENFDFSPTEIVFSETGAVLATNPAPETFIEFYTNDSGKIFDPLLLEFSGGTLNQLSQVPANSSFGAIYDSTINGNWSTDGLALPPISTTGTPTATGKLDLIGNSVTYDFTNGFNPLSGAIKFKITPNYSGAPSSQQTLIYSEHLTQAPDDRLQLVHSGGSGNLTMTVYDINGTIMVISVSFGSWLPTAGVEYEMEFNWDFAAGQQHIFIDGVELGSGHSYIVNRGINGTPIDCRFGDITGVSDFELNDLLIFKILQHSSDYTPGYDVAGGVFAEAACILPDFVYSGIQDITSYTSMVRDNGVNDKYVVNGQYWDGAAWAASDSSYAQASTADDLSSNFATFSPVSDTVSLVVVFPDSDTQGTISRTDFNYVGVAYRTSGKIVQSTFSPSSVITTFSEVLSNKPVGTTLTYIMSIQSVLKWYDGAAWVISDGSVLESNSAAEVQNNLSALSLNPEGENVSVITWLATSDTQETPEVTTVEYQFTFDIPLIQSPSITVVYGIPIDISGNVANQAQLSVKYQGPPLPYITGSQVALAGTVTADARPEDGAVILELISSSLYGGKYLFKMSYLGSTNCRKTETWGWAEIPAQAAINFIDLVFTEEP